MTEEMQLAHQLSIREAGYDEAWLQKQIYDNPTWLGLGEVEAIGKERVQSSGGRLDILLKDPEDDTMYEVELMLGETDESHIIRTIEYWDNEKRRWPQRQHFAVLVAEHINRRFFNVIHLLSHSIPIIGIQVSLLQVNGGTSLFFSKVLDTFEEVDDGTSLLDSKPYKREDWTSDAEWTVDCADTLLAITEDLFAEPRLNYVKNYMAISVAGNNYFTFRKRSAGKSLLGIRISQSLQDEMAALLEGKSISYVRKPGKFRITVDKQMIENQKETFRSIADLVKKTWQSEG